MLRLAILLSVSPFLLICGLIRTSHDISGFEDNGLIWADRVEVKEVQRGDVKSPLWVLRLSGADLEDLKLRRGSERQEREFENAVGPIIATLGRRQSKRVKKDDPTKPTSEEVSSFDEKLNKQLKKEIMRVVNKFVLSTRKEPDAYLNDSDPFKDEPSLALYFKDSYTSLTVQYGRYQWNYFIGPPSPLPDWFYQQHTDEDEEAVPSYITTDFYKALAPKLQMFLGYPV